ncbi:MAG TPA: hypothetical protein VGS22_14600 [Thermoanaerobaculia bacterium]|jgi:hypothetical protein|nr:hypothetical protein [Thermoanaerobaculia bacterium]
MIRRRSPDLFLFEPDDLLQGHLHFLLPGELATLHGVMAWVRTEVCRQHEGLGRRGPVCPFVRPSLEKQHAFYLAVWRATPADPDAILDAMLAYRDWFLELEPDGMPERNFKTILVTFPAAGDAGGEWVETVQKRLKPLFVSLGLMIGQFYPACMEPGLHNPSFRPLAAPFPLMVIRHMQLMDLPFLADDPVFSTAYRTLFDLRTEEDLALRIRRTGIRSLPLGWRASVERLFEPEGERVEQGELGQ